MHGAVAPVVQVAASELEAKLGLAEFLLASTDLQVSARRAVDWLVSQTPIRHAVVPLAEPVDSSQLVIVAEHGVSSSAIVDFVLTRDDEAHPLIKAMHRREPTYFDGAPPSFRAPIEGRFHALPFAPTKPIRALGLLLTSATAAELQPDVTWLATLLSKQVVAAR